MEPISRSEALEKGLTRFFTGKPCKRGHIAERSSTGGQCRECEKLRDSGRKEYSAAIKKRRYHESPIVRQKRRLSDMLYREKNLEKLSLRKKERYPLTRKHQIDKAVQNYKDNKEARNASQYARQKANPVKHICHILISTVLKKVKQTKDLRTHDLLGYSPEEFRRHIEKQFKDGMTWQNHGEWHVDHIKPVHLFIKEGIIDMKIINALTNLQPLWAAENLSKQGRYCGV